MTARTLILATLALAAPARAQDFQSTEALDAIVAQFTGKPIGTQGGAISAVDKRLKLAACAAPQLEWRTAAHDAVVVRCMAPQWRIFVAVEAVPQPRPATAPATAAAPAAAVAKPEPVIRRGDAVTIEAGGAGFAITRDGVAASDAPAGGRLTVRIDDRKPPIQAIAIEPGRARLPGWGE